MTVELVVSDDATGAAAEELSRARGHVALSGGSTPKRAYELAAWRDVEIWFADERCVPPDDERSNYRLVSERVEGPAIHRIRGELPPAEAAARYDEEIRNVRLDVALLGIGPDGHTASLFPDAPALAETERAAVAAEAGLEPFVPRVTLTIPKLSAARLVLFLVTGADKADAVARAFRGEAGPATPASLVRSAEGRTVAILDPAAAAAL